MLIGRNLLGQRVLLNAAGIAAGLFRGGSVLLNGLFKIVICRKEYSPLTHYICC